jgi:Ca2+/H+ antiporter
MDKLLSVIFMVAILLLVLPGFLQSNSQLKQFLKNLSIWIIVVLVILMIVYLFK